MTLFAITILVTTIMVIYAALHHELRKYNAYVIKKGKHYCSATWERLIICNRSSMFFRVMFSNGASYILQDKNDQKDINKLYGLGWGLRGPTYNSLRVGWRFDPVTNLVELFTYVHDANRGFIYYALGKVSLLEEFEIRIYIDKGSRHAVNVMLKRNDANKNTVNRHVFVERIPYLKYRLFPYFGGNQTAPENIKIFIKEVSI